MRNVSVRLALAAACAALAHPVSAQLVAKPDGEWRGLAGLSFTSVSGNADNSSLGINVDAVRQTEQDKITLHGQALRAEARVAGQTAKTSDLLRFGGKYDWNLSERVFAFGAGGYERDRIARLENRWTVGGGLGYKITTGPDHTFDVFGGLNARSDSYTGAGVVIDGRQRTRYAVVEMQLGEESAHKLTETTSVRQRFVLYPNLDLPGEYRAVFDAGLVVSMTDRLKLTVSVLNRYDSLAEAPIRKNDLTFFTGVSYAFGPK